MRALIARNAGSRFFVAVPWNVAVAGSLTCHLTTMEVQMRRVIVTAAALLLGASTAAFAAETGGASRMSPGQGMQNSTSPTNKGASEYSPGDRMKDKGTVGKSKGASEYSPGDRMNDQRKRY